MLVFNEPNTTVIPTEGIACHGCFGSVSLPPEQLELDYCFCLFECETEYKVFSGVNSREKDYFTFYYNSKDENATNTFTLLKGSDEYPLTDSTYGEIIAYGYELDWTKVANELGHGVYTLKEEISQFGRTTTRKYGKFRLLPFSLDVADGTVKIESYQSGKLENSFDFCEDSEVRFSFRVKGYFGNEKQKTETSRYVTAGRVDTNIQTRIYNEYELIFNTSDHKIARLISENMILGSRLYISDYNVLNPVVYDRKQVVFTDLEKTRLANRIRSFVFSLEDANKNIIKSECC